LLFRDGMRVGISAEFGLGLWLLRALPAVDVLLVGLEYDVAVECILIEVFFLARPKLANLLVRVDGLMVAVDCPIRGR
jgi:hypothetical protein